MRFADAATTVFSIVVTACVLFCLWAWLSPVDFWQKLVTLVLVVVLGLGMFIGLMMFFTLFVRVPRFRKKKRIEVEVGYE
jgi:uncharacterized BrkB/YihY/UPF0761 family membrane protein